MMPIAARYADVWHCFGPPGYLAKKSQRLSGFAEAAGRDPGEIGRAASLSIEADLDGVVGLIEEWESAGFEYLVCGWPEEGRELVERFARRVLA
jgi:alkanesulfonate monooxygenase SsuD/methylene tetrahydromethanopterin reductase-like flavin-dependent oxidoreductase (luciferase family)